MDFIAQDDQPLSISDSPSFRRLCVVLNKSIVIPGRTKMSELVEQRYYELKEHVKSELKQAESVNITTDTATTIAQHALQAVTVHDIDSSWRMRSAPSERAFSKVGIVVDKLRSRLLPEKANQLVFLKHNVRNKT